MSSENVSSIQIWITSTKYCRAHLIIRFCGSRQLYRADPTREACVVWSDDGLEKDLPTHLIFDVDNSKSSFQDLKANAYPSDETKQMGKADFCLCGFWM